MRNPNGYGSVTRLSGNRRRPFMVKKTVGWDDRGYPVMAIIGYTETREEGNILLASYNRDPWDIDRAKITLEELYNLWVQQKAHKLGSANQRSLAAAYRHCTSLTGYPYRSIKAYQMQSCIDHCGRGASTQANIKNLWTHLGKFALEIDVDVKGYDVDVKGYADLLTAAPAPPTSRTRFTDEEIDLLWNHSSNHWIDTILILIYSGWRISEFLGMKKSDVDLSEQTMYGDVKTKAGKNRVVPIHSLIAPFVEAGMALPGKYLVTDNGRAYNPERYRSAFHSTLARLGHHCQDLSRIAATPLKVYWTAPVQIVAAST